MAAQPWPLPRLTLDAVVDPVTMESVTYTVTHAKTPGSTLTLDPGDGREPVTGIVGTDGTCKVTVQYHYAGEHTYTARVVAPCPVLYATWQALCDSLPSWSQVPDAFAAWADASRGEEFATATVTVHVGEATINAQAVASPTPAVRLSVVVKVEGTYTVQRIAGGGYTDLSHVIFKGKGTDARIIWDMAAPLGVPLTYRLVAHPKTGGAPFIVESNTVRIDGSRGCWLTDPISGRTIGVEVQSWDEREFAARQSVLDIVGRPDPVVVSDVHARAVSAWVLLTRTREDWRALYELLTASRYVLLRTQPASSLETVYAVVGTITEKRVTNAGDDFRRMTEVAIQECAPISTDALPEAGRWDVLAGQVTPWSAVPGKFPTWAEVGLWTGAGGTAEPHTPSDQAPAGRTVGASDYSRSS